jgi:hydrophobe/amphiphile efflux-1 (HAE1) family protein
MHLSKFFVDRPVLAAVLSIVIFLTGCIAMIFLPVSEYPEVVPPTVVVHAVFPGANPREIAQTVATPIEEQINGVENMLYMSSQATPDGVMTLTITFRIGTNIDTAQVQVQNRVAQAEPRLPEAVRQIGVTTVKSSPDLTMVVHLFSPDGRYDPVYLRNYAVLQVKDTLARIPGVGQVLLFGSGDYAMRVWLDPEKVASRSLTPGDIVRAIREQNVQVAAGVIGAPPDNTSAAYQLSVNAHGRLSTEAEFGDIIIKTGENGETTRLRDVSRIELGAAEYALRSLLDNKTAVALPIFQSPGSNAIEVSNTVRRTMQDLKKQFPEGVDYSIVYDPTIFVRDSIKAVVETLLEAVLLVVIVVVVFLQTWRASVIPLLAVPVSIIGTFAIMLGFGFSINALSLFGLVLAIGIVVDDAIVVVENVERNIELGMAPREATYKAMDEVSGPIVAIALVLCAVFVPIAFVSGLTGQFYRQFALTIAFSTVISAFNSLTLSPALCALLLQPHGAKKDALARGLDFAGGWFFRGFNWVFGKASSGYGTAVVRVVRRSGIALVLYVGLIGLAYLGFRAVPTGFVPVQDKQYLVAFAQLPDAATLDRTESVIKRMTEIGQKHAGVESAVAFPGLSINGFVNSSNAGIIFFILDDFDKRKSPELSGPALAQSLQREFGSIQDAFVAIFPPPSVSGLGTIGGFKLQVEDRASLGEGALYAATQALLAKANQTPELGGAFSSYQVNVPQLSADVDRVKAKRLGVQLADVFDTMQVYLGSSYVNDFNRFGRTYRVVVQADAPFRSHADDIARLKTRNAHGEMIPLGSLLNVRETFGPDRAMRYNAYPASDINGQPAPGASSGQAMAVMAKLAQDTLPNGMGIEWTELSYQQIMAGNTTLFVFPLCVLLAFLVLAAQWESWSLPFVVILIVPMSLLSAIAGVWLKGEDNNIFTQIGLIVLVGLACKNAILIVEFARAKQEEGLDRIAAVREACRLRLRPILMTSFAFIMGVIPLVTSTGAGSEMRRAMGVAVFSGMLGVTFFGLLLTPVFYVVIRGLVERRAPSASPSSPVRTADDEGSSSSSGGGTLGSRVATEGGAHV